MREDSAPRWRAVQTSVRGRLHEQLGIPCQDKTFALRENGVFVVALADGAGSAPLSHYGAEAVTRDACQLLTRHFDEFHRSPSPVPVCRRIIASALACLREVASVRRCALGDLACTLLAVAVSGERFLIFHLGDGVVGYLKNGRIRVATRPVNGEFSNMTYFVTSPRAPDFMQSIRGSDPAVGGFALMSDGCEPGLYNKRKNTLAPALARLLYRLSVTSEAYLYPSVRKSVEEVIAQRTRDDCSLILAARQERTYDELTPEELDDFFDLSDCPPDAARELREGYLSVLALLDEPRSGTFLAERFAMEPGLFREKWLLPLLRLRYAEEVGPNLYRCALSETAEMEPTAGEEKSV